MHFGKENFQRLSAAIGENSSVRKAKRKAAQTGVALLDSTIYGIYIAILIDVKTLGIIAVCNGHICPIDFCAVNTHGGNRRIGGKIDIITCLLHRFRRGRTI